MSVEQPCETARRFVTGDDPRRANLAPAPEPGKTVRDAAAFLALCPAGGLLGLDPGRRAIGVAGSDATRRMATPLETLRRSAWPRDLERLQRLADARAAAGLVVGLPLNMDGSEGPQARAAGRMARALARGLGLPALLWDERLSSFEAEERMRAQGLGWRERAGRIDAVAASVILEDALEALAREDAQARSRALSGS